MSEKTYRIELECEKKVISIIFIGNPAVEDVAAFHQEYMEKITPIQTGEYLLLLDAQQMSIAEPERLHQMQVSFALYRKSGFKEIRMILQNDEMRRQVLKLLRFSGITDISDVSYITPDERESHIAKHVAKV